MSSAINSRVDGTTGNILYSAFPSGAYNGVDFNLTKNSATTTKGISIIIPASTNWVLVPGNAYFGTLDFYVSKYEAKCVDVSNYGYAPLTSPDTGYHTYDNATQPCTGDNLHTVFSPEGYPIANVTHDQAANYCYTIGAHLLRNDEYMTIARNAEQVASNWTDNIVGSGSGRLYSGNIGASSTVALIATSTDSDGYFGIDPYSIEQRRTLTLSNGSVIWDLAGNVAEHVQRSVNNSGDLMSNMILPATVPTSTPDWGRAEYASSTNNYINVWTTDVPHNITAPSNSLWTSNYGIGTVNTFGTGGDQGTTVFIRGDSFGVGDLGGLFSLDLSGTTNTTNYNLGFRCAQTY
jgi:hypothetical protein